MLDFETGVNDPAAGGQGAESPVGTGTNQGTQAGQPQGQQPVRDPATGRFSPTPEPQPPAEPAAPEPTETTVPVSVIQALRDELRTAKDEAALYRARGGQPQQGFQQHQAAPQTPADPFAGLGDDDLVDGKAVKRLMTEFASSLSSQFDRLNFAVQNPGYQETIQRDLVPLLNDNPGLAQAFQSGNLPQIAVEMARTVGKLRTQPNPGGGGQPQAGAPPANVLDIVNQIIENSKKPRSPAQAGASAGISDAARLASMSNEDFSKWREKMLSKR